MPDRKATCRLGVAREIKQSGSSHEIKLPEMMPSILVEYNLEDSKDAKMQILQPTSVTQVRYSISVFSLHILLIGRVEDET